MLRKLKPKDDFSKSVLTLVTGTTLAQAIPVAISPVLTRLYTPEEFGVLAVFLALTAIFGTVANGRYELAIMLPKKDENALNIVALALLVNIVITIILFVIVLLFSNEIAVLLDNDEIRLWLYLMPLSVFLIGFFNILTYYNNRKKFYKDIAKSVIVKSIVLSMVQLLVGFVKNGADGLISGQIVSQLFSNLVLIKNIIKNAQYRVVQKLKMIALAKRYIDFPRYSAFSVFLNSLNLNLVSVLISSLYSFTILGYYSLIQRVLGLPLTLIGSSVGQVFFNKATQEKRETQLTKVAFDFALKRLFIIGVPFFLILFFIVEDLFRIVFGEDWAIAGVYAKILIPLFFIRFLSSSLSLILSVYEKQKVELLSNITLITTSVSLVFIFKDFEEFLYYFSFLMSLNYGVFLLYYYRLSRTIISK